MQLLEQIIEAASDGKRPLADVLRKCLILAFDLKNETLKHWVECELNGFSKPEDVPPYRVHTLHSKGNFAGGGGAWIPSRPLPMAILKKEHRDVLVPTRFAAAIAVYDTSGATDEKHNATMPWSPDLVAIYQSKFIQGYALSQAWQEIPASIMVAICEEVRNRILRFALEIREELGLVEDKPSNLPAAKVEAAVINHIYGGTNIIAGSTGNITQIAHMQINEGDLDSLADALKKLEIRPEEIEHLRQSIELDNKGFGAATKKWFGNVAAKFGEAGLKIGTDVGTGFVKAWLRKYFGPMVDDIAV